MNGAIPDDWNLTLHPERLDEVRAAVESCPDRGPEAAPGWRVCRAGRGRPPTPGLACGPCCTACRVEWITAREVAYAGGDPSGVVTIA